MRSCTSRPCSASRARRTPCRTRPSCRSRAHGRRGSGWSRQACPSALASSSSGSRPPRSAGSWMACRGIPETSAQGRINRGERMARLGAGLGFGPRTPLRLPMARATTMTSGAVTFDGQNVANSGSAAMHYECCSSVSLATLSMISCLVWSPVFLYTERMWVPTVLSEMPSSSDMRFTLYPSDR